ncbi:MAG: MarR family winged helix-turn-helix transcriptional regulator [Micropruina sp.]|uniref:MarR family winged helix-turn-helix transcriptional regulator n=1 Tax=Micropruina sp. TaxID=2737536 RepID=UPI0039E5D401
MSVTGQLLFSFVRHWSRRAADGDAASAEQGRLVLAVEAVHAVAARGEPATVNAVAAEIGIDQSGASRLIGNAARAGCLGVAASSTDGRRREVSLTDAGHTMLEQAHAWQEQVFDRLTEGWSLERRDEFHRAMADLIDRSHAIDL